MLLFRCQWTRCGISTLISSLFFINPLKINHMKKFVLIAFCVFGFGTAFSQTAKPEVVATAGDYFKNAEASLSWTIGECVTETFGSTNMVLTQGFQQSHYIVTAINDVAMNMLTINAFPNPATDFITVSIENYSPNQLFTLVLCDLQGRILFTEKVNADKTQLNMSEYAQGVYFVKVIDNGNKVSQTFKIRK